MTAPKDVIAEAAQIIHGSREDDYGTAERNLNRIAVMWSAYLGYEITARNVAMCMVLLKVSRDAHREKRDNIVDGIGYFGLAGQLPE